MLNRAYRKSERKVGRHPVALRVVRLDIEIGVEDYEESTRNYEDWCGDRCDCGGVWTAWIEYLRSLDVYPPPVLARPLFKRAA